METSVKIQDKVQDKIAAFWEATIAKIQKYYPKAKFIDYDTVWGSEIISFIVSPKKQWVFDMLNKVLCNYGESGYYKPSHPSLSADCNRRRDNNCYKTENVCYSIGCHKYLNGNSLVSIVRLFYKEH